MITEEKFKKNSEILKETWISEIDDTLENIKESLKHFFSGIWGFLFNKIVIFAYKFFLSPDIREKSVLQIEPILNGAKILNSNNINEVLEQHFEEFKKNDLGYIRCKHKHKKFPELIEKMKENYITRVKEANRLLCSDGDCYSQLIRNAYEDKETAIRIMRQTLYLAKESLDFSVENKLLKLNSLIKDQTIRVLYGEIDYRERLFKEKLERIFTGEDF
ncbi:MAG: hypothetical protein ACTSO9_05310 [Candidatus Helarchaeota archaeon]